MGSQDQMQGSRMAIATRGRLIRLLPLCNELHLEEVTARWAFGSPESALVVGGDRHQHALARMSREGVPVG
jgi:hypothetical protein